MLIRRGDLLSCFQQHTISTVTADTPHARTHLTIVPGDHALVLRVWSFPIDVYLIFIKGVTVHLALKFVRDYWTTTSRFEDANQEG